MQGFGWEDTIWETKHERAWTGLVLHRIRTSGGILWAGLWTFGFHKIPKISWFGE